MSDFNAVPHSDRTTTKPRLAMNYDTHHARFRDDIGAFLAGGLGDADRRAFEDHAAGCPECAAALAAAAAQDADLQGLFATARPADGLEDRLVGAFRHGAAFTQPLFCCRACD